MSLFGDIGAALGVINPVAALGTAAEVAGPVLGYLGQQDTNANNAAIANNANAQSAQNAAVTNNASMAIANKADAMEYDFAQNGLSWKIADAAKNGISPLAALGAAEPSASPAMPVLTTPTVTAPSYSSPLTSLSAGIPELSQNISRAIGTTQSPQEKQNAALDLAYKAKQNDLLDIQIANAKVALAKSTQSPGMPLNATTYRNLDGSTTVLPADPMATRSVPFGGWRWEMDNKLIPDIQNFGSELQDQIKPYYLNGN